MLDLTEIQQALARGYCHASNADKKVDSTLIFAMAAEVLSALQKSGAVANEPPTAAAAPCKKFETCQLPKGEACQYGPPSCFD
ncbi:MAG: hypothetical protein WBM07_10950 [Chitinivibrionales bacterium]